MCISFLMSGRRKDSLLWLFLTEYMVVSIEGVAKTDSVKAHNLNTVVRFCNSAKIKNQVFRRFLVRFCNSVLFDFVTAKWILSSSENSGYMIPLWKNKTLCYLGLLWVLNFDAIWKFHFFEILCYFSILSVRFAREKFKASKIKKSSFCP